ncbi:MAG: tripartite tricarboxylate transporter substrate binding protein [Betaproteobacteria bacterium]|nr:tripartite tricarboxylate transporter substrate binding protein [Betaproteobacteria bacterium]
MVIQSSTRLMLAAALVAPALAGAQAYPNRPIQFIVPFAAAGAGDIFARTVAQKLTAALGQQVVVVNRPGANGIIGTEQVAKAAPDGYTLLMATTATLAINPSLYEKLPYDSPKDFAPVTQGTLYQYILIVHPSVPARSVAELVKLAKAKPGQLQYGSSGIGGSNHLAGEMFKSAAKVDIVHVPFKGSAPALAATIAGQVSMMFDTIVTTVPRLEAGKVRALAVTGEKRAPQAPDIPTLIELGYKNYKVTAWQAIAAPAGTPRPIIQRLYKESAQALKMPDVVERLGTQGGNEIVASTPEEFAQVIREEIAFYARVIKDAKIRVE